ncbi:hypothetical protein [Lysobacter sp. Root96]|uniref:hypothetical protein n=1 Tax=Lysobacter sp. Root96 TaxID=1736612 RepID=UPI000A72D2CE|nr:hypothetical protein [Lysobacter sp. Root96]
MNLTPEQLDRLELIVLKQAGKAHGAMVAVTPGELQELVAVYRQHFNQRAAEDAAA